MTRRWLVAALGLSVWGCARAAPMLRDGTLPVATALQTLEREELAREEPWEAPASSGVETLRTRQVVFVAGFLNELIPGYFTDNVEVTRALGAETLVVSPSSVSSLVDDAERLSALARERFTQSGRPVVLFGHSKGGAAVVLAVLRHPELILEGVVDRVISVQGALGGSPVANVADGPAHVFGVHLPIAGLASLEPGPTKTLFHGAVVQLGERLTAEQRLQVSRRILYVRSTMRPAGTSAELRLTSGYLARAGSGASDGLVLVEDMKLDDIGVDLGVLEGDHACLTVSSVLSNAPAARRRAFTRALWRVVYGAP